MYASIVLAILLTIALPFARAVPAARGVASPPHSVTLRPQVVENGTDLVLYHFMGNIARPVAFTPDGSSWSVLPHGLLKIAPDGTNTLFTEYYTHVADNQNIVYSSGFLWFTVYHGIVRIKPDGTDHRFYQFTEVADGFHYAAYLSAGSDGLYFTATSYEFPARATVIGRIDSKSVITLFPVTAANFGAYSPLVMGPDGREYLIGSSSVYDYKRFTYSTLTSLFRLEADGSQTLLGSSTGCAFPKKAIVARGALYFIGTQYDAANKPIGSAICRATISGKIAAITPIQTGNFGQAITADASGNIWTTGVFGAGLYSYGIATKQLAGPYEPSFLTGLYYPYLYTGPDQNIWLFGTYATNQVFYGAYVRHLQRFIPTSIALTASAPSMNFYVSEPIKGGPWTAASLDPAVATVTPGSSLVGRFNVVRIGPGTTSIVVTDAYGNVSFEPVTSN